MRVFIDTSFWIAELRHQDSNHAKAREIRQALPVDVEVYINNLVFYEALTVSSLKAGRARAIAFGAQLLEFIDHGKLRSGIVDEARERTIWRIFREIPHKGIGFVDCSILAMIREYQIDTLLSFDQDFKRYQSPYKFKLNAILP